MQKNKSSAKGFSAIEAAIVVLVVAALGFGGWYVWSKKENKPKQTTNNTSESAKQAEGGNQQEEEPDPYADWKTYSNAEYGVSFKHPADWTIEEVSIEPSTNHIRQEFSAGVKHSMEAQYNNTIALEILDQSLQTTSDWYDNNLSAQVIKTADLLKNRKSVQYTRNDNRKSKLYVFDVNQKTYIFRSINEELNVQLDPEYWSKFDKIFDSLQISK